jgi:hypothetical protein
VKKLSILLLAVLGLTACDRPFSDVGEATVEVVSPDVRVATDQNRVQLDLRVTSIRDVTGVSTNGIDFASMDNDLWRAELDLHPGLNRFLIESIVDDGPTGIDTVDVLRVDWSVESMTASRPLLFGTGAHTMSLLSDGSLVLMGGSTLPGSGGTFDAWVLSEGGTRFNPVREQSIAPRVGHTATVLPDDRILLIGGGESGNIDSTGELVELVEVFDPASETFTEIPVDGPPVRRMYHTAILRNIQGSLFVVVLGGRGDTRYTPTPELGIRRDMRTFQLRNDSLISLSPAVGPFIRPVAGHTQIALDASSDGSAGAYLVTGMDFESDFEGVSLVMDFDAPAGIDLENWAPMLTPRIRHASVAIAPGYVIHLGGRDVEDDVPLDSGEIHVESARKSFYLPPGLQAALTPAYGATATRMEDGRIAIIGGFDASANSLSVVDFVSLAVQ